MKEYKVKAIKNVRKLLEAAPDSVAARTLSALVIALETDEKFDLSSLYALDYDTFELAIQLLQEWRLDRYYSAKFRLLDSSVVAANRLMS
jgi:hypothetical protein